MLRITCDVWKIFCNLGKVALLDGAGCIYVIFYDIIGIRNMCDSLYYWNILFFEELYL